MQSDLSGFYAKSPGERLAQLKEMVGLSDTDTSLILSGGLTIGEADAMRENVLGLYALPLSIATNFRINCRDYLIPMVGEEPSVVAAASKAAKMTREFGGFTASSADPVMIGEIHIVEPNPDSAQIIDTRKRDLISLMDEIAPTMRQRGGGARDIWSREYTDNRGRALIIYFSVDVRDSMGANTINRIAEELAPAVTALVGGRACVRVLSNLSVMRISRAKAYFTSDPAIASSILDAQSLAENDVFRAVTHNKGIMNGIVSLALATGNDTRAVEAGVHGYASYYINSNISSPYRPLTKYYVENGKLAGEIELPLQLGTVGGGTGHKVARICLDKILQVKSSQELCSVAAAVGLAQNFAALRALTQEGISRGHMRLHSKTLALIAGATPAEAAQVYEHFRDSYGEISMASVKEALEKIRGKK